jgi:tyrosyl-tRNA synthetase
MEIISFLVEGTKIFNSNGQARQKVGENAISINKQKINLEKQIDKNDLLHNQYILVQQGKKNYFLVHIQ